MKNNFIIIILLLLVMAEFSFSSEIKDLIEKGRIEEARQQIARLETAITRDGDLLYCQALLESDGQSSDQFLQAAFKAGLEPGTVEEASYRSLLYLLAAQNYGKLAELTKDYLKVWENGQYRAEVLRLASVANEIKGNHSRADYYRNLMIKENSDEIFASLGNIDKANALYSTKHYGQAQKICRKLRTDKFDEAAVPALFMLSRYSLVQKRVDDAILYYNILKEGYPMAIGLGDLMEQFGAFEKSSFDTKAEEITGTVYSIQVGVFSVKDNAKKMSGRMKKYGRKVEITKKTISGKSYYVVFVGRFISQEQAIGFKTRLEQNENELFHVEAR